MRTFVMVSTLMVASCSAKPSPLLGALPKDATEFLGTICAHTNGGSLKADGDFKTAKIAFTDKTFAPGLEAVRCLPAEGPDPALNSLVFDHETHRLYALRAVVAYADLDLLEKLLLPALSESERAGFALERMRLNAPWMSITTGHFWSDGHVVIWTQRTEDLYTGYNRWPPKPETTFQITVSVPK